MKRYTKIFFSITFSVVLLVSLTLFSYIYIYPIWNIGTSQANYSETFITSSESPDGKYILEAYRTEPGATVDFSIKVYMINDNKKLLIYNAYHEYDAKIIWVNDSVVLINDKKLDLSLEEKYDWQKT